MITATYGIAGLPLVATAGADLMLIGAGAEWAVGVKAAGKSLESISQPLQSQG